MYCKNTVKSFWRLFDSKLLALIAKFSVLVDAAIVLLDSFKKLNKEIFSISNENPYSL